MKSLLLRIAVSVLLPGSALGVLAAPFLAEEFNANPAGRFTNLTASTESSFIYNPAASNLTAVLDVDQSNAFFLSATFPTVTAAEDISFSFEFRITDIDDRVRPSAFIGLLTTTSVNGSGDGLTVVLATTNGVPIVSAAVDQGSYDHSGASIRLQRDADYLAVGRYVATTREFTVEVFSGPSFATFLGRSTAIVTNLPLSLNRFGLQNDGARFGDQTSGSLTLLLDDFFIPARPPVFVAVTNSTVDELDLGATNHLVFHVTLSSPSVQTVRVDFATVALTATDGRDFLSTSGTLVFTNGATNLTVSVPIVGDLLAEPNETIALALSNPVNANLVVTQAVGTIRDNEYSRVTITDGAVTERLGTNIAAVFIVSLSHSNSTIVTLSYATANGDATSPSDYAATNGFVTFTPGVTTAIVTVQVIGDSLDESNEVFFVNLSELSPTNAFLADAQGQCVITNASPPPLLFLDSLSLRVFERDSLTNVLVPVYLMPASGRPVTVSFAAVGGTARGGATVALTNDFLVTNGVHTIPAGQTSSVISLIVFGDPMFEPDETFSLFITNPPNATLGRSRLDIELVNDDPIPNLAMGDTGVVEGHAGSTNALFTIRLSNPSYAEVTVMARTVDATARAGEDYVATNRTFVFPAESTNLVVQFTTQVAGDLQNEGDDSFLVRLENPVNATLGRSQGIGVITNDDFVGVSVHDAEDVIEGHGGTRNAIFRLTLSGPSVQQVCVWLATANLTAVGGSDYDSMATNLFCFDPGVTELTVSVPVRGDTIDEFNETFCLYIVRITNAIPDRPKGTGLIVDDDPPLVSISTNSFSIFESNVQHDLLVTFSLTTPSTDVVSVSFATSDGAARARADYVTTNRIITFAPGTVSATCRVAILGDEVPETNESFFINLNAPVHADLGTGQAVVTIIDDDVPILNFPTNIAVLEGDCSGIPITMDRTSAVPVEVWICLSNAPPFVMMDCGMRCCTNFITPGSVGTSFTVCGGSDGGDFGDFGLGFGGGGGGQFFSGGITVINTNEPRVLVREVGVVEGDSGTTNLCFDIRLTSARTNSISVDFATLDGGARAGWDYAATRGTFTFAPGETNRQLCIPVYGDIVLESNEVFFVTLTNASRASLTNFLLRATITNDDQPPPIMINDPVVVEGQAGCTQAVFIVSIKLPTELEVTVGFTSMDGTAINGSAYDYIGTNGSLIFLPGVTNLSIPVCVLDDLYDEINETFQLQLHTPSGARIGKTNGLATIIDDDPPEIRIGRTSVIEGNTGVTSLVFVVTLSSPSTNVITVDFLTRDGTAQAGTDYVTNHGSLHFLAGDTNRSIAVQVNGDLITELNETVFLCLTNAVNGTLPASCETGVILDDDWPCVAMADVTVEEPLTGTSSFVFTVTLGGPSSLPISVGYTSTNGTATSGLDYVGQSGTLNFPAGATSTSLTIEVNSDDLVEEDEKFAIVLNVSSNSNVRLCTNAPAFITIKDGTVAPIVTITNVSIIEGATGATNLIFNATLNRPSRQVISVDYQTLDATANAGSDYRAASGRITFPTGVVSATFIITNFGDCIFEGDEYFLVSLTNAVFTKLSAHEVRGTILNDDPLPTLSIDSPSVRERDLERTNLNFRFSLSCPSALTTRVDFATANGTATDPADYASNNGAVIFPPGTASATVSVIIEPDRLAEPDDTIFLVLTNPQGVLLATNRATGTILDDDAIVIGISNAIAMEGTVNHFTVTLSKPSSSELTIAYVTADNTATASPPPPDTPDYAPVSGVLRFPSFVTNQTISIMHSNDSIDELDEFYFVNLSNPSHGTLEVSQAKGTILDGTPPCLSVNNMVVIDKGQKQLRGTFTVSLSSITTNQVSFAYATRDGTAFDPRDYSSQRGVTNIPPGAASVQIAIEVKGNTIEETNEFFYLDLSNATNASFCDPLGICTIVTGTNAPPTNGLSTSSLGGCLTLPTNITLRAAPFDSDGIIAEVQFFANADLIRTVSEPPYEITWIPNTPGVYRLTSVAQDNIGDLGTSPPIEVTLRSLATNLVAGAGVIEGPESTTNLEFVLRLASPSCETVSIQVFTMDDTAQAGIDYEALPLTEVTFAPGQTSALVPVRIFGDTLIEPDETFVLVLTNPVNVTLTQPSAIGTIINDDNCTGQLSTTPLPSVTVCACGTATLSTVAVSPDPVAYSWRLNGRLIPGATNSSLTLNSLTSAEAGVYSVEANTPCQSVLSTGTLTVIGENIPTPVAYSNPQTITINPIGQPVLIHRRSRSNACPGSCKRLW